MILSNSVAALSIIFCINVFTSTYMFDFHMGWTLDRQIYQIYVFVIAPVIGIYIVTKYALWSSVDTSET